MNNYTITIWNNNALGKINIYGNQLIKKSVLNIVNFKFCIKRKINEDNPTQWNYSV